MLRRFRSTTWVRSKEGEKRKFENWIKSHTSHQWIYENDEKKLRSLNESVLSHTLRFCRLAEWNDKNNNKNENDES